MLPLSLKLSKLISCVYAPLFNDDIKSIILITCKEDSDDAQVVYIGYLRGEESYLREQ